MSEGGYEMKNPAGYLLMALVLGCLLLPDAARAETIYLKADFNDKTPDQVIGTGGAAVGEPIWVDAHAGGYVRQWLPGDPLLEISDGSTTQYGNVWFRFLGDAAIDSGILVVTFTISIFDTGGGSPHIIAIKGGEGFVFAELQFMQNFDIRLADQDGAVGVIGSYNMSTDIPVAVAFDLNAGTYDVWLSGQEVHSDEPIAFSGHAINQVVFSVGQDEDLVGKFFIDDVFVTDNPDAVPVEDCTWGRVKSLYR
jgi:hypothetical protein